MPWAGGLRHDGDMTELIHPAQLDPRLADLTRQTSTGFTGGLCRALAERWQVDPIIVRLVVVALSFAGGVGVALYAWGWLLTPRSGGTPPILRWLPAFGGWPKTTQAIIVAVTSLVLVLSVARQTGVAWGPVIVIGALAWAMARRRTNGQGDAPPSAHSGYEPPLPQDRVPADRAGGEHNPVGRAPDETVEQWRARLSPHADSPLPAVDLYAPEEPGHGSMPVARTTRRSSWAAASLIVVVSVAAGAVPFAVGMSPTLLYGALATTGTAAVLILGWSVAARKRRLPQALLVLALAAGAGTGLLATTWAAGPTQQAVAASADPHYTFVGEVPVEVDLTTMTSQPDTVTIDATASVVRLQLAEIPRVIDVVGDAIRVETNYPRSNLPVGESRLVLDGDFSVVEVRVGP